MLAANATFTSVVPVVTVGHVAQFLRHIRFGIGAVALFRGGANGNQRVIDGTCAAASHSASCRSIMAEIDAEHQGGSPRISRCKAYPLIQVKLGFRFWPTRCFPLRL